MTDTWHDQRGHPIPPPPPLPPAAYAQLNTLPATPPRRTIPLPVRYLAGVMALAVAGVIGVGIGHHGRNTRPDTRPGTTTGNTTTTTDTHSAAYTKGFDAGLNAIRDMIIEGQDPAVVTEVVHSSAYSTCQNAIQATEFAGNDDALQGCADGMHKALAVLNTP